MEYVLLMLCTVIMSSQSFFKKSYGSKCPHGTYSFTVLIAGAAALFFALVALLEGGFSYEWSVLPFSLSFGVGYAIATVTGVLALNIGSLTITSLLITYSLMIPTLYGLLFLHEQPGVLKYVGIALLVISLYLVNAPSRKQDEEERTGHRFSIKWLLLVLVSMLSNGIITIILTEQQTRFAGAYKNEFMIVSLLVVCACMLPFIIKQDKEHMGEILRKGAVPGVLCGLANGGTNLLVMVVTRTMAKSVFFPAISGGSMIVSYIVSRTVFKERYTLVQNCGILLGIVSLVLLNI